MRVLKSSLLKQSLSIFSFAILLLFIACRSDSENAVGPDSNSYLFMTPEDPDAPYVRPAWREWIKANHHLVTSLSSEDFKDLAFLPEYIGDKSIVLMGEVAHGIAEQNRIRVRLIKYLHQHHGFNVVAFESGLYDCYFTNRAISDVSAITALKSALYSMWHTTDLRDLYTYIKST